MFYILYNTVWICCTSSLGNCLENCRECCITSFGYAMLQHILSITRQLLPFLKKSLSRKLLPFSVIYFKNWYLYLLIMVALIARGREDDVGVIVHVDHVDHVSIPDPHPCPPQLISVILFSTSEITYFKNTLFSILSFSLIISIEKYHLQIHINILNNSKCLYTVCYPQS